jgi:hypothetical protein
MFYWEDAFQGGRILCSQVRCEGVLLVQASVHAVSNTGNGFRAARA